MSLSVPPTQFANKKEKKLIENRASQYEFFSSQPAQKQSKIKLK